VSLVYGLSKPPGGAAESAQRADIDRVIGSLGKGQGGLIGLPDVFFTADRGAIISLSARNNVPTIYDSVDFAREGGLPRYGASYKEMYRRHAKLFKNR
jgi:hypothetical protein